MLSSYSIFPGSGREVLGALVLLAAGDRMLLVTLERAIRKSFSAAEVLRRDAFVAA